MAPKSKAKRRSETASQVAAESRKQQRLSSDATEGIAASVETALTSSAPVGDLQSSTSSVGAGTEMQVVSAGPSGLSASVGPSGTGVSHAEGAGGSGDGGMEVRTGEGESFSGDTDTISATEDAPTSRASQEILGKFVDDWLGKDDTRSLAMFLCYHLVSNFSFTETKAAEFAATMLKKSDRTVRRWRSGLIENDGNMPESEHGRHQRSGVMWKNEELNKKATEYVRSNAAVKGRPNLTSIDFCRWVNESLLPNSTLEPGFPRRISLETARTWLHQLGFEVLTSQKGIFIDGHERSDVVNARKLFLRKMAKLGFLHFTNAPTEDAAKAIPTDIDPPTNERRSKTVVFFHDESTFMSNEDQPTQWGMKGEKMLKPKSRGAGIMVSDFIDEHNGFLALSEEE